MNICIVQQKTCDSIKINTSSSKSLSERKKDKHLNKMATYYIHKLALPFDLNVFGPVMYSTKNVGLFIEMCFIIVNKYPVLCILQNQVYCFMNTVFLIITHAFCML